MKKTTIWWTGIILILIWCASIIILAQSDHGDFLHKHQNFLFWYGIIPILPFMVTFFYLVVKLNNYEKKN